VNRSGDRTATSSTLVSRRGLMPAGRCLAARPLAPGRWPTRRPAQPARQAPDLGLELLEMGRSDPTTAMEVTRCSIHRSHRARRHHRSVGSAGSPGASSGAGHPARSTGAPPPAGSCPPDTTHVMNRPDLPARPHPAAGPGADHDPGGTCAGPKEESRHGSSQQIAWHRPGRAACSDPAACLRADPRPEGTSMLLEDRDAVSYGAGGVIGGGIAKVLARSGPGTSRGSRWST
jgi:hypothetical protein